MKALITGATGLVGYHLTKLLLENEIPTVVLGRNEQKLSELEQLGAQILKFDLTQPVEEFQQLKEFGDPEYVWFHCAAAVTGAPIRVLEEVNIKGTEKLVRVAEEAEIRKLILVSSIATYGLSYGRAMTEDLEKLPETRYGETKLVQEQIVKNSHLDWSIIRPPYIVGPYDENVLVEFSERISKGKMPRFSKTGKIGFIDARDLAEAMYLLAKEGKASGQAYNIQSAAMSMDDFVELFGSRLDLQPPYGPKYPYSVAMIVGFFAEIGAKLRGKSAARGISRYRIRALTTNRTLDSGKIENELGFEPKYTIKESIDDWIDTRSE